MWEKTKFYYCRCFYTRNIFIKQYKMHFLFVDINQFTNDYAQHLHRLGCDTPAKKESLIKDIKEEINRRKIIEADFITRKDIISNLYKPFLKDVYTLKENVFEPSFLKLVKVSEISTIEHVLPLLDSISKEKQLYGFPIFKEEFCSKLLLELEHFEQSCLPKGSPNTMNKYGVLLDELGFRDSFSDPLRKLYLNSLAQHLFPNWAGSELDSHKIFSVSYKIEQDTDLDFHYDNSEVTLNVCLGQDFSGGELYFGDIRTVHLNESTCILVPHKVGYGILHRGQQMHGALPITKGTRQNLIMWMRSSTVRNNMCPMCDCVPDLTASLDYGDGFTEKDVKSVVQVCVVI